MDKKKLLLVAVSVGIFLIIVIGLSILLFLPRRNASAVSAQSDPVFTQSNNAVIPGTVTIPVDPVPTEQVQPEPSRTEPASANPVDMLRNPDRIQGLQPPPTPSTMTQENNIYIYGDPTQSKTLVEQVTRNKGSDLVIEIPKPSTVAVPSSSSTSLTPTQDRPQVSTSTVNAPEKTTTPTTSSRPSSSPPATASPAAKAPTSQTRRAYEDYWIQAGAFSTAARAEGAKENLSAKGITAIIENRDVNGRNLYRVRVGPFTSQHEADYWLSVIKKITGFEDSQIRQSSGDR